MLIIVVIAGIHFRFRVKDKVLSPGRFYKIALVICCLAIAMVGVYGVVKLF